MENRQIIFLYCKEIYPNSLVYWSYKRILGKIYSSTIDLWIFMNCSLIFIKLFFPPFLWIRRHTSPQGEIWITAFYYKSPPFIEHLCARHCSALCMPDHPWGDHHYKKLQVREVTKKGGFGYLWVQVCDCTHYWRNGKEKSQTWMDSSLH